MDSVIEIKSKLEINKKESCDKIILIYNDLKKNYNNSVLEQNNEENSNKMYKKMIECYKFDHTLFRDEISFDYINNLIDKHYINYANLWKKVQCINDDLENIKKILKNNFNVIVN